MADAVASCCVTSQFFVRFQGQVRVGRSGDVTQLRAHASLHAGNCLKVPSDVGMTSYGETGLKTIKVLKIS